MTLTNALQLYRGGAP